MINGKQHAVRFHVDDSKSGQVNPKMNDNFEVWLNKMCGQHGEVKTTCGETHDHLGMTFECGDGEVKAHMTDYIENMLREFLLKFQKNDKTANPAKMDVFCEDNSKKLNQAQKEIFHTMVAKAPFASKRA